MYNFIDVTEVSEGTLLPSEALQINGEYIENQIDGYRTLNVSGRESLSPELSYFETGIRDGSVLNSRRYPARILVVTYQLIADSNEAFREAYNKLGKILNVENAQLIFNDEQDKFYIGTPSAIGEIEPGRNAVVGEIEIFCADPFKYSVLEYEAEPETDSGTILIDYNGTYKAYPTLEADFYEETEVADDGETAVTLTGNGDCGYIAFFTEDEKIIQIGDPDEVDAETVPKSQTLVNQTFLSSTSWGTTAKALWSVNSGPAMPDSVTQTGSVAMKAATFSTGSGAKTSGTLLTAKSTASAPTINYKVTAQASGRTETSVKVSVVITTSLGSSGSYFGRGYGLVGSVYMGGAWHDVTLKKTTDYWKGNSGHTSNVSFTVSGLSSSTTSLTGIKFKVTRSDTSGNAGKLSETACSNLTISAYSAQDAEDYYLAASSYGTVTAGYHGPSITRTIGADAAGEVGATDFTFTYKNVLAIGKNANAQKQLGSIQIHFLDESNASITGFRIVKNQPGKIGSVVFYVNGRWVYQTIIDMSYANKYFGVNSAVKASSVTKTGSTLNFNIGGFQKTFVNSDIATKKATKIIILFEQYSSSPALSYNGLYWAKFVKNNCETLYDVPNKFSANDVVEADCKNGKIYLNGVDSPQLGALGNDWEQFYLTPGLNMIGYSYSDWVQDGYEPKIKVRYREVFL